AEDDAQRAERGRGQRRAGAGHPAMVQVIVVVTGAVGGSVRRRGAGCGGGGRGRCPVGPRGALRGRGGGLVGAGRARGVLVHGEDHATAPPECTRPDRAGSAPCVTSFLVRKGPARSVTRTDRI